MPDSPNIKMQSHIFKTLYHIVCIFEYNIMSKELQIKHFVIGGTDNFENVFENTPADPGKISMAVFFSIFSYGGW